MKKPDYFERTEEMSNKSFKRRAFISFIVFDTLLVGGFAAWKWLLNQPADNGGVYKPLRSALETNEKIFKSTLGANGEVKTYSKAEAVKNVRVNGLIGIENNVDEANWRMQVVKGNGETLSISLDDIKKLPKTEIVFDFKCIEGWDQITHWGGVTVRDFMTHYGLQQNTQQQYAGLQTVDKKYYVGIDMKSFLLPQTMLCYEMNGAPLPIKNGYPLRLIIPVKYGIKNLKSIGTLFFSNQKPPDYWAEQGYDYYSGF